MRKIAITLIIFIQIAAYGQQPRLVLPIGHTDAINSIYFSLNGKYVVTASDDKTAKVWDAQTGFLVLSLKHSKKVRSALFSPDGSKIITTSEDTIARIWDAHTGSLLSNLVGHTGLITYACFDPEGRHVLTCGQDYVAMLWDVNTGNHIIDFTGHNNYVVAGAFSPTRQSVATGSYDGTARIWDVKTGKTMALLRDSSIDGSVNWIISISYSPDGQKLVTLAEKGNIRIWDPYTGRLIAELKTKKGSGEQFNSISFSGDSHKVITASGDGNVNIWDASTGALIANVDEYPNEMTSAAFSPARNTIIASSKTGITKVWDFNTGNLISNLKGHATESSFSPDGREVATISGNSAQIWDVSNGNVIADLAGHTNIIFSTFFSSGDSNLITTSGVEECIKIWDAQTGRLTASPVCKSAQINSAVACGQMIVTCDNDSNINVWKLRSGAFIATLKGHDLNLDAISLSPDEKEIATISVNGKTMPEYTVKVWDVQTGNMLFTLRDESDDVSFSPDGKKIVVAGPNSVRILDAVMGSLLFTISNDYTYGTVSASFSPDGKNLVSCNSEGQIFIWNANTGNLISANFHTNAYSASFSPNGNMIVVSSKDSSAQILNSTNASTMKVLKGHTSGIASASFNMDGQKIVTASYDNTAKIFNSNTGLEICTFFPVDENDYFIQLPNTFYQCSPSAAKLLHYVTPDLKVITFEQLDVKYNRPDKVLEALGNTDTNLINSYKFAYYKRIKKLGIDTAAFTDGYTVPETDFANRDSVEYEQTNDKLKLHITGADSAIILDRFNIWVNESPLFGVRGFNIKGRKTHNIDTTITIILSQGKNTIETSVTNVNATESYRKPLVVNYTPANAVTEKVYFIGIGIDHFKDSSNNLQWSVKDIRDEAKALKKKFGNGCVITDTLFNERVTTANVLALKEKLQQTTVNDKVIIAYSGHGLFSKDYDYYLSTYDINFSRPQQGGLSYDELENLLDSIPARKKLMLLDACHSGEVDKDELVRIADNKDGLAKRGVRGLKIAYDTAGRKLGMKNSFELMQSLFVNVGRNTGAVVISAAGGTQFAYEKGELGNGVFTHCVLEEMNTDHLAVSKLQAEVSAKVSDLTAGLQVPTARSEIKEVDWEVW